jgi:hypothetical protein
MPYSTTTKPQMLDRHSMALRGILQVQNIAMKYDVTVMINSQWSEPLGLHPP